MTSAPPLDPALEADITAAVDARFEEQIAFLQKLVSFPSLRGQEHTAQNFMFDALRARGYATERWAIDVDEIKSHPGFSPVAVSYDNAINVVGTHHPRETKGRSLILNGHMDVVPEGPLDMWSRSPWDPHRDGDWLYGRGSGDMKAGLAANVFAIDALRSLGYAPAAALYQQSVTEEECTGNGALACLVRGYRAEAAIIPEPSEEKLTRGNVGVIWFKLKVRGHPVHVREAGSGSNAIEAAYLILQRLRKLEAELNEEIKDHPEFAGVEHPINLNVGEIRGGDWASSVPAWCDMDFRIALWPGTEPADLARRIEAAVAEEARKHPFLANLPPEIVYNGFFAKGYLLEEGGPAEALLADVHGTQMGAPLDEMMATGYLDGRVFVLYGDCPCLVYGPKCESIHGFDERVSLDSMRRVTKVIALFAARWCGLYKV